MQTITLLPCLSAEAPRSPATMEDLEKQAVRHIEQACPEVTRLQNCGLAGPYDDLDNFMAPGTNATLRMSALVRSFGRAHAKVWGVTDSNSFKAIRHSLPTQ